MQSQDGWLSFAYMPHAHTPPHDGCNPPPPPRRVASDELSACTSSWRMRGGGGRGGQSDLIHGTNRMSLNITKTNLLFLREENRSFSKRCQNVLSYAYLYKYISYIMDWISKDAALLMIYVCSIFDALFRSNMYFLRSVDLNVSSGKVQFHTSKTFLSH